MIKMAKTYVVVHSDQKNNPRETCVSKKNKERNVTTLPWGMRSNSPGTQAEFPLPSPRPA